MHHEPRPGREDAERRGAGRAHIPVAVRDTVFERDGGCCTYIGTHGARCESTHDLEIDHTVPIACGGADAIDNLRLLCASHNRLEAEPAYGAEWMQRFY
jgi:5-methylcytosine-specific restriction endonuclease McrA